MISNRPLTSGVHYWELEIDGRTDNEMKIGVTVDPTFDKNTAFCDSPNGFGFYSIGQLRNGSSSDGPKYGVRFRNKGVCGIYLNMNNG